MENKRKNVYITIFVITTILASAIAIYFYLDGKDVKTTDLVADEINSNSQLKLKDEEIEELKEEIKTLKSSEPEVKSVLRFAEYDSSKYKNGGNSQLTDTYIRTGTPIGNVVLSKDGKTVTYKHYSEDTGEKEFKLSNLPGKVLDVIAGLNTTGSTATSFLLMEDGTVYETSDLYNMIRTGDIKVYRKIDGVTSAVRICYANNNKGGVPIAIDKDGNCYDLTK